MVSKHKTLLLESAVKVLTALVESRKSVSMTQLHDFHCPFDSNINSLNTHIVKTSFHLIALSRQNIAVNECKSTINWPLQRSLS